jgi:hypothetical protein
MKKFSILTALSLAASFFFGGSAQAGDKQEKNIVQIAAGAGQFNTLVAAVKAAGLADTLQSAGPFTVFAPTDEAFAKLPKAPVESLFKPANKAKLVSILTFMMAVAAWQVWKRGGFASQRRPLGPCACWQSDILGGQDHGRQDRQRPKRQPESQRQGRACRRRQSHQGGHHGQQWRHPRDRQRDYPRINALTPSTAGERRSVASPSFSFLTQHPHERH